MKRRLVMAFAALLLTGMVACAQPGQQARSSDSPGASSVQASSVALETASQAGQSAQSTQSTQPEQSASQSAESASSATPLVLADCPVLYDADAGDVCLDISKGEFNDLGFTFGDSVDVEFSNGYKLENIPYYDDYYTEVGGALLVAYHEEPYVKAAIHYAPGLWEAAGLADGDTATVTLVKAGAYFDVQDAFGLTYSDNPADYDSVEQFANFRAMSGGRLRANTFYRSASPVSNERNRAAQVNRLMADAGIQYDFDLSDSNEEIDEFLAEDAALGVDASYFADLHTAGKVAALNMGTNYQDDAFKQTLATWLVDLSQSDGPCLIHCIEGKDRTGFTCALLEALAGATYQEIIDDYLQTFANYYGITKEGTPSRYNAVRNQNIDNMLRYLAGVDKGADLSAIDFSQPARDYLRAGGMSDEQIDALVKRLVG